jgi:hypothetical protein
MSRKKENCDVFMGLCGAYNENQYGKCDVYSDGMCHNWIEPDIRDRIAHCEHRNRMRDRTLRKAICDSLQQTNGGAKPKSTKR